MDPNKWFIDDHVRDYPNTTCSKNSQLFLPWTLDKSLDNIIIEYLNSYSLKIYDYIDCEFMTIKNCYLNNVTSLI